MVIATVPLHRSKDGNMRSMSFCGYNVTAVEDFEKIQVKIHTPTELAFIIDLESWQSLADVHSIGLDIFAPVWALIQVQGQPSDMVVFVHSDTETIAYTLVFHKDRIATLLAQSPTGSVNRHRPEWGPFNDPASWRPIHGCARMYSVN